MNPSDNSDLRELLTTIGADRLPGHLGFEVVKLESETAVIKCDLETHHLAPNGYLHAGTVVALADTAAGYGCMATLPPEATGFTTIELKANFVGTLLEGALRADARMVHGGRTNQVWDVTVVDDGNDKELSHFRCTQMILYPR